MADKKNTIVVTGGGGFLGSHLCEQLSSTGKHVIAVDNFSSGFRPNRDFLAKIPNVNFIEADVCAPWKEWLRGVELSALSHVYHFASPASPPHFERLSAEIIAVNTIGLQQALSLADHLKSRLVFASTSEVYGDPTVSPQPESYRGNVNTTGPRSCYDESKRLGETIIHCHNQRHKTKHGIVRIFNTYGPRMNPNDGRVIINFLVQALKKEALTVYGDGKQSRSFCYVDDLIEGIIAYGKSSFTQPVNIGNGKEFSILHLAQTVQELFTDKNLSIKHFNAVVDDPQQRNPDLRLAKELLHWEPKIPLKEGLVRTLAWLKAVEQHAYSQ